MQKLLTVFLVLVPLMVHAQAGWDYNAAVDSLRDPSTTVRMASYDHRTQQYVANPPEDAEATPEEASSSDKRRRERLRSEDMLLNVD